MSELADLLAVVAIFTGIHFVFSSLRNWRDAVRLVPIGSLTPDMINEYKTIPLCFAGGDTLLMSILSKSYGRFLINPQSKKQAVLCETIAKLKGDRSNQLLDHNVAAGTLIQAKVAEGENSHHIRKCARRCTIGNELVLAILLPTVDGHHFRTTVRCITVRARGRAVKDNTSNIPSRIIEWEVIDPAGIGARADLELTIDQVPLDAFWLICGSNTHESESRPTKLTNPFYPYGSSKIRGFLSWVVTHVSKITLLSSSVIVLSVVVDDSDIGAAIQLVWLFIFAYVGYMCLRNIIKDELPQKLKLQAPKIRRRTSFLGLFKISTYQKLDWHGSTRRSLAIGDRIRRVGFWQQFYFVCWEPLQDWFSDVLQKVRDTVRGQPPSNPTLH